MNEKTTSKNEPTATQRHLCDCADISCPAHYSVSSCRNPQTCIVHQNGKDGMIETPMCDECANDTLANDRGAWKTKERIFRFTVSIEVVVDEEDDQTGNDVSQTASDMAAECIRDMGYDIVWNKAEEVNPDGTTTDVDV